MKTLKEILENLIYHQQVDEKLIINKDSKLASKNIITEISKEDQAKINDYFKKISPNESYKIYKKLEEHMNKGSEPKKIVKSIFSKPILLQSWWTTLILRWNEAIKVFGEEIDKRDDIDISLKNLHQYIYSTYQNMKNSPYRGQINNYKHYMDLYNIKY